jgi:hypothetical protein
VALVDAVDTSVLATRPTYVIAARAGTAVSIRLIPAAASHAAHTARALEDLARSAIEPLEEIDELSGPGSECRSRDAVTTRREIARGEGATGMGRDLSASGDKGTPRFSDQAKIIVFAPRWRTTWVGDLSEFKHSGKPTQSDCL